MEVTPSTDGALVNQNDHHPDYCRSCGAKLECPHRQESFCLDGRKEENTDRVFVRITSYRRKLCDDDNLFEKYFIDACRYAGLIRNDSTKEIVKEVRQLQVGAPEEERTTVELIYPNREALLAHNPPSLFA